MTTFSDKSSLKKESDREYSSGAVRSDEANKGRWDVMCIQSLSRYDGFYGLIGNAQEYLRRDDRIGAYLSLSNAVGYIKAEDVKGDLIYRLGQHAEKGAVRYKPYNWQKGLPASRYLGSIIRHWSQYLAGQENEDHLAAALWNVHALMWTIRYLPGMNDLPKLYLDAMEDTEE